tara:strand:- start:147 stop:653 length:507 start_codon:yes stop_codon:yes gene_type:complete
LNGLSFEIIPYSKKYYDSVNALIDSCFGNGYSISVKIHHKDKLSWCALNDAKELIGFSLLKVDGSKGVFELTAVDPAYRGIGVGTSLFDRRINRARSLGLKDLVLYHWYRPFHKKPFCALKYGFYPAEIKINYWFKQSLAFGYACLECKQLPCLCNCVVYKLRLVLDD